MKKRVLLKNAVCAVFFMVPLSGYTAYLGGLGSLTQSLSDNRNSLTSGIYDDYYTFSTGADISDTTLSFALEPSAEGFFQAGAFSIELYEGVSSPAGAPIASAVSGGGQDSVSFPIDLMSNTTYTLRTIFVFNAEAGITANATTRISQVPVPAAAWLFGSSLIGLAGLARRRRK